MRREVVAGLVCLLLAMPSAALADPPPPKQLTDAEEQYGQQQYRRTVEILRPLLYPKPVMTSVDDIHRARELLGAAYWFLDEKNNAKQEWQLLLFARPGLVLDKFVCPKPMRDFFENLRNTLLAQGVLQRPTEVEEPKPPETVLRITHYVEKRSRALTWMPFGAPQFDSDADGWGVFFATGQGLSGLTSVGSLVALTVMQYQNKKGFTPGSSEESTANALFLTTAISGAVFYTLYTWGVIDANTRFEPSRVVRIERSYDNTETADIRPPQPGRMDKPAAVPRAGGASR